MVDFFHKHLVRIVGCTQLFIYAFIFNVEKKDRTIEIKVVNNPEVLIIVTVCFCFLIEHQIITLFSSIPKIEFPELMLRFNNSNLNISIKEVYFDMIRGCV